MTPSGLVLANVDGAAKRIVAIEQLKKSRGSSRGQLSEEGDDAHQALMASLCGYYALRERVRVQEDSG